MTVSLISTQQLNMQHLFSTLRILLFKRILHPFSTSRLPACHGPFVRFEHDVLSSSAGTVGEHGVMKPTKSFGFFSSLAQHIGHRPSASPHHHQRRPSASTSTTHRPTPNAHPPKQKKRRKFISETDGNSFKRFQKQDCLSACGHADIGGRT